MEKAEKKEKARRVTDAAPENETVERRNGIQGDRQVFLAIQRERYLKRKVQNRFCSAAEKDVIEHIIRDSWEEILPEIPEHYNQKQRISLYCNWVIVFPYFVVEEESLITVDFRLKRVVRDRIWNRPSRPRSGKGIGPF